MINTSSKTVSVLIPMYNSEATIAETLQSVIDQSYANLEIVVVDDGSSDKSIAVVKSISDSRIRLLTQGKGGASKARNTALAAANGEWIQYLDADDLLAPDKIELQLTRLKEVDDPRAIASCRWARFYASPGEADHSEKPVDSKLWCDTEPLDWLIESWRVNGMMHPAAWLIPSAITREAGPWDEVLSLNDDGEYFSRILLASSQVLFCSDARTYYRSGTKGSLSNRLSADACESLFRSIDLISSRILERRSDRDSKLVCANAFQLFVYTIYPLRPDLQAEAGKHIAALGGSNIQPPGGPKFQLAASLLGWKLAKRLQRHSSS